MTIPIAELSRKAGERYRTEEAQRKRVLKPKPKAQPGRARSHRGHRQANQTANLGEGRS